MFLTAALYNVIDAERFATPFFHLCTGSTFLGGFFLATEWASSPGRQIPMMLYGLIGGAMVIIIRVYGIYPDGVPFAILLITCWPRCSIPSTPNRSERGRSCLLSSE